jgi:hypothetical protein
MRGIVADVNITGQVDEIVRWLNDTQKWKELWQSLNLSVETLESLGLDERSKDDVVWETCQRNELILITGNRNHDGPTSLEATIQSRGHSDSLPVITISKPEHLQNSVSYFVRVCERLLEILFDIPIYRGVGRLYIP